MFTVSPGPDRHVYNIVESETGFVWVVDLSYETALAIAGEMNAEAA